MLFQSVTCNFCLAIIEYVPNKTTTFVILYHASIKKKLKYAFALAHLQKIMKKYHSTTAP